MSLDDYVATLYADQYYHDTLVTSPSTLGGVPAVRVSGINKTGISPAVEIITLKDDVVYGLSLYAKNGETRDMFLPVFEQIVSSFQFTQ